MEEKTPVTILQEIVAKLGILPTYDLLPHDVDSKLFKMQVSCSGLTSTGIARSKKEAKQIAASTMIEKINSRKAVPQASDIRINPINMIEKNRNRTSITQPSPTRKIAPSITVDQSKGALQDNHVQNLMRLCSNCKLKEPVFKELDMIGPDHAKIFVAQCSIGSIQTDGIGKTKKQAKSDATRKMIDQIKNGNCDFEEKIESQQSKKLEEIIVIEDETVVSSKQVETDPVIDPEKLKINYDLKLQSQRTELIKNLKQSISSPLLRLGHLIMMIEECQRNMDGESILNIKQEFQSLLDLANIDFHHMLLQTLEPVTFMLIIQLNSDPDILEMSLGCTKEEAELRTIKKIVLSLEKLLK